MEAKINQKDLEKWADYLLEHSLGGIDTKDVVMLKGEHIAWPLISVLQDKIFSAGAIADVCLVAPDNNRGQVWGASVARHGTEEQIKRVPAWHKARYEAMTKYIEILGSEAPELCANLPDKLNSAITRADMPFKLIRLSKPWVLTLFPTEAFAGLENMSLREYTRVVLDTSLTDPKLLENVEEPIFQLMSKSKKVIIQTECPHTGRTLRMEMNIDGRNIVKCTGKNNFPDGEVFTSPDANSVNGEIFVDLPVYNSGVTIQGIYLKIVDGKIIDYRADKEPSALKTIIETDDGSHRIGELALGMNKGLKIALKHPLFVEKVGGTLHIAIGESYPECYVEDANSEEGKKEVERLAKSGVLNRSAQHIDIVVDFREGGAGKALYFDDTEVVSRDNIWVVK